LLEGLEIKEKDFSSTYLNKDFRIDSQFYTKEPAKNSKLKYEKIGNIIKKAQYGVSIAMNEDGVGYPIYRMNEIHNMLCDMEVSKFADISKNELKTFTLNDRDVVFNRTNSFEWVGRTGLYKKLDNRDFVFASYLVRFIPNEDLIFPEYLSAFLNSKQGVWDIKRRARQSINQTNVNPEEVKEIEIPLLSKPFQENLKECFDKAFELLIDSKSAYTQAEQLLLQELNLANFQPSQEPVNVKSFSESFGSSGRLDAEYYQSKFDQLEQAISSLDKYETIGNISELISRGKQPVYLESEQNTLPVLNSKHIRENKIILDNRRSASIDECNLFIEKDDVLINGTGVGTIGRTAPYLYSTPSIPDNHVTIIRSKSLSSVYISVYLNSIAGQLQVEKYFKGSSGQIELYPDDISNFLIWIAPDEVQMKIENLIKSAFDLEKQSEHLLEVAKQAVEMAIEQDEKTAMRWIKEQTKDRGRVS